MKELRFAIIGLGNWGKNYLEAAKSVEGIRISYLCKRTAPEYVLPRYELFLDWRKLLDVRDLDGAIVATGPDNHLEISRMLLGHGIPVLVEKPFTVDPQDFDLLPSTSVPFLVNHIHLFSPYFEKFRKLVMDLKWQSNYFDIYSLAANFGPFRNYSALYDYGSHDLSMLFSIFDEPITSFSCKSKNMNFFDMYMNSKTWTYHGSINNRYHSKRRQFRVTTDEYYIEYDDTSDAKLIMNSNSFGLVEGKPPLTRVLESFRDAIITGKTDYRFGYSFPKKITTALNLLSSSNVHG